MAAPLYAYTVSFRPGDDLADRPVDALPCCMGPSRSTSEQRDDELGGYVGLLESQGYRVERVIRWHMCGTCEGVGTVAVKPKGWRKRTPPPWYLVARRPCNVCQGAPQTIESTTEASASVRHTPECSDANDESAREICICPGGPDA